MKMVFADTLYWTAIVKPNDQWKEPAKKARQAIGNVRILTTDGVLTEFLNLLCKRGEHLRSIAVKMVNRILEDPNVEVLAQTRDSFLDGLKLYGDRLDKEYSLTDCISMNAMRTHSVTAVLTNDPHFGQDGFSTLIKK